jgi:DNA-binding winged helix-turn-helix (wHTH) protein
LLSGILARLVAELLAFGGPVRWDMLCRALWGGAADVDDAVLRHRLDVTLQKLRKRFEAAGIRRDLIVSHGTGQLELVLLPGDAAEDHG